jgi:elongation factor P hydroxylase
MRIEIYAHSDIRAVPQSFCRGERQIDVIEIMDQWYGPGYRYIKVRGHDSGLYILRLDEVSYQCELIMFATARAQEYQREYHDMARSAQSR